MIRSARQLFISKPIWARNLFIFLMMVLLIGGVTTLVVKQGLVRWPLKVATGPSTTVGMDFLATFTKVVAEERPMVQLKRIKKESFAASAKALEDGEADLAIVRSDIAMPSNGLTIAILRRDNLVLIVSGRSKLDSFQKLGGRKVALLKTDSAERNESLSRLLDGILNFYSISPGKVGREFLSMDEIGPAIARNQVDGVLALGPSGLGSISKIISTVASSTQTSPKLIGEKQAAAIAKTISGTEPNEVDEGAFGGIKPKPEEAMNTLAVTFRLVGRHSLPDFATGEIARLLTLSKAQLIATSPFARNIEAPDSDDGSNLPVHPGAAAYFDGEQDSLTDSAVSIFYLISITLGLLGSGFVWLFSIGKNRSTMEREVDIKLLLIVRQARSADIARLAEMEMEIDAVVAQLLDQGKVLSAHMVNVIAIATQQLDRRRELLQARQPGV
jgi:TRAP-type uncharacterized transport system substrate-binding protein